MKYVGYGVSWLAVIVCSSIFYGFVLSILWGWFVVPALHAPTLSIPLAIGLSQVVSMFTYRAGDTSEKSSGKSAGDWLLHAVVFAIVPPLLFLAMGFIVHLFV